MTGCPIHHHGISKARGCTHAAASNFGKLFPNLDGVRVNEEEAAIIGGPGGLMHDYDGGANDSDIPAGYIFFSQFIDHDITLDTTSGLRDAPKAATTIDAMANIRSASLDLDCVYGFGPEGSPHCYDAQRPGRLGVGSSGYDLVRSPSGAALIGDPRNDENIFVAQIQLLFHRFHNKLYTERVYQETGSDRFNRFEEAQKQTRYHYQWLVLFDLLKRLCDPHVYQFAANLLVNKDPSFPFLYKPNAHGKLSMPVEFSVAAYRVGHTMVRSVYAVNDENQDVELFDERFGTAGFSALPEDLVVDWRYLLPVSNGVHPRMAKAIDPLLADEIQNLPVVNSNNPNDRALAFRNLLRGNAMSLPAGQDVAAELASKGYPVDPALDLRLGDVAGWNKLDAIDRGGHPSLSDKTPLFYYILRESEINNGGQRLGPVGSAILMEVFGGMLAHCDESIIGEPDWNPDPCVSKEKYSWWQTTYQQGFNRSTLVSRDDYYPFELADVVRFVYDEKY